MVWYIWYQYGGFEIFCSLVEIDMLSIKVTLDHVILMGLVITGNKLWSKLFTRNCWGWWCSWVLNRSKFWSIPIIISLLVSDSILCSNSLYFLLKRHSELLGTLYKEPTTIELCNFVSISIKTLSKKSTFDSFITFHSLYLSLLLINMPTPTLFITPNFCN